MRETLEQNLEMMRDNLKDEYRKRVAEEELKMLQGKQQATKSNDNDDYDDDDDCIV